MGNLIYFSFDVDSENSEKIRVLLKRSRVLGDPQELSGLLNLILAIIILNLIPSQAPQKNSPLPHRQRTQVIERL